MKNEGMKVNQPAADGTTLETLRVEVDFLKVTEDCGCSFRRKDLELGKTNLKLTCAESEAGKRRRQEACARTRT